MWRWRWLYIYLSGTSQSWKARCFKNIWITFCSCYSYSTDLIQICVCELLLETKETVQWFKNASYLRNSLSTERLVELKKKQHFVTHIYFLSSRHIFQCSTIFLSFQLTNASVVLVGENEAVLSGFFWCIIPSNFYSLRCTKLYLQKHHNMSQEQLQLKQTLWTDTVCF